MYEVILFEQKDGEKINIVSLDGLIKIYILSILKHVTLFRHSSTQVEEVEGREVYFDCSPLSCNKVQLREQVDYVNCLEPKTVIIRLMSAMLSEVILSNERIGEVSIFTKEYLEEYPITCFNENYSNFEMNILLEINNVEKAITVKSCNVFGLKKKLIFHIAYYLNPAIDPNSSEADQLRVLNEDVQQAAVIKKANIRHIRSTCLDVKIKDVLEGFNEEEIGLREFAERFNCKFAERDEPENLVEIRNKIPALVQHRMVLMGREDFKFMNMNLV